MCIRDRAGIGSQLSPALCNVAITLIEHSWHQIHNNLLQLSPTAPTHRCGSLPRPPLATTATHTHPDGGCSGHRQSFPHSHIGRHHRKHPTQRTIQTSDITTIVAFALDTCIFRACNNTYKQIRGAGIGSQLSPALCNVCLLYTSPSPRDA